MLRWRVEGGEETVNLPGSMRYGAEGGAEAVMPYTEDWIGPTGDSTLNRRFTSTKLKVWLPADNRSAC